MKTYLSEVIGDKQKFKVKLISVSKPDLQIVSMINSSHATVPTTAEHLISYCARVSNPSNQGNFDTAGKLLKYCMDNGHWSVFEMAHVIMEIESTRDILRQLLRHRSFSFQEFSQRYADPTKELGFVKREARLQDEKNRQNSIEVNDEELQKEWLELQAMVIEDADAAYKWAISKGIAKEQARAVLPEGLVKSRLYMAGTLRSWIHFYQVRTHTSTQKENREVADACMRILQDQFEFLKEIDNAEHSD